MVTSMTIVVFDTLLDHSTSFSTVVWNVQQYICKGAMQALTIETILPLFKTVQQQLHLCRYLTEK